MGVKMAERRVSWALMATLSGIVVICSLVSGQGKAFGSDKEVSEAYWPQWLLMVVLSIVCLRPIAMFKNLPGRQKCKILQRPKALVQAKLNV